MLPSLVTEQVRKGIEGYLQATFSPDNETFARALERFVSEPGTLFKGPYLGLRLPFQQGSGGALPFKHVSLEFNPYLHQELAFQRLCGDPAKSTLVATGTGSGKTECFLYPLLEHCAQQREQGQLGVKAIVIYPMNALANDQAKRFAKTIFEDAGKVGRLTVGMYVGGRATGGGGGGHATMSRDMVITSRDEMRKSPPDILLTNYKMLDYLLVRPQDRELWRENGPDTLKYIVVDELHTFDGAQGTDLACLLRRLKARLETPENHICAVGTSATLGGGSQGDEMRDYAATLFGEPFDDDSVITEQTLTPVEFLLGSKLEHGEVPSTAELEKLVGLAMGPQEDFIAGAWRAWFGEEPADPGQDEGAQKLGDLLKGHGFFRSLLHATSGRALTIDEVAAEMKKVEPGFHEMGEADVLTAIGSMIALVSRAKAPSGVYPRHFLQVRYQLWLRELRRLVASVGRNPDIRFSDDLKPDDLKRSLPVVSCRECGAMGWAGTRKRHDSDINPDLQAFYSAYFAGRPSPNLCFAFPQEIEQSSGQLEFGHTLCGWCLHLEDSASIQKCTNCGRSDRLAAVSFTNQRITDREGRVHGSRDCPACSSRSGLSIVGSQAASLSSVAVNQLFSSPSNDDRKLLAFSDSVQDASHRAGFFNARTYTFSFRVALQACIDSGGGDGASLSQLPDLFVKYWEKQFASEEQLIASFLPADLHWLEDYAYMCENNKLPAGSNLPDILRARLNWEVISEFSFRSQVGRTLEKACCSSAFMDSAIVQSAAIKVRESLENQVGGLKGKLDAVRVERFLTGMLQRLRVRGGVHLPQLQPYMDKGETFRWNRHILSHGVSYLPALGQISRAPRYLTFMAGESARLDGLTGAGRTWHDNWLKRCFGMDAPDIADHAESLWQDILPVLVGEEILMEHTGGGASVYGLNPDKLVLSSAVSRFTCSNCENTVYGPGVAKDIREEMECLRLGCEGHYKERPSKDDFYSRLFRSGRLDRVFAREHTGLLERDKREDLEDHFINGGGVAAPNLLSCTPTLEMGINIGDLSSVLLCSVPPSQANYLQRVGRAGRRDGNSFNLVLALAKPHDLYFYEEPLSMLAGDMDAPGTFLNAPAVLERQYAAFCMDCWINDPAVKVPDRMKPVLDGLSTNKGFPFELIEFTSTSAKTLFDGFLQLFDNSLDDAAREYLEKYALGEGGTGTLALRFAEVFHRVESERRSLLNRIQRTVRRIRDLETNPARDQNFDETMQELKNERWALERIIKSINEKDVFNFLTDEGVLPNYAFPEAGVLLRSVILKRNTNPAGPSWMTDVYEYERSASSALGEFAPANHFYAGGRRVTIDRVDLGVSKVEDWRFCPDCPRSEPEVTASEFTECPSCGSAIWSDAGQCRQMLRMAQVFATSTDKRSQSLDSEDERKTEFYRKHLLVYAEPEDITVAYKIASETLPFGFEFLSKSYFRDINFGLDNKPGEMIPVAGREVPREGFHVCNSCGQVDVGGDGTPFKHAIDCQHRHNQTQGQSLDALYLYREFQSEAIRMLLPVSTFAVEEKISSFMAALYLGLKLRFEGNVDHLQLTHSDEPDDTGNLRKRYLVLYDRIPGGTGYLKELMKSPDSLMDLFQSTLDVLKACPCGADPEKDGCYRCLYAYRVSRDMDELSRSIAIGMLSEILEQRSSLEQTQSLQGISLNPLFDSELEARFIEALKTLRVWDQPIEVSQKVVRGKPGFHVCVNGVGWDIEPQVSLGEREGVSKPSKADFVFWPENQSADVLPVAVFTDGFGYHADLAAERYRVGLDFVQRVAILRSGNYRVWSLTYDDVEADPGTVADHRENPFGSSGPNRSTLYDSQMNSTELSGMRKISKEGSMDSFVRYLGLPDTPLWKQVASIEALLLSKPVPVESTARDILLTALAQGAEEVLPDPEEHPGGGHVASILRLDNEAGGTGLAMVLLSTETGARNLDPGELLTVIRLMDGDNKPLHQDFKKLWNGALSAHNLFQFLDNTMLFNTRGIDEGNAIPTPQAETLPEDPVLSNEWAEVMGLASSEFHGLLQEAAGSNCPQPTVGFELADASDAVIGSAEIAWEAQKIAVLADFEESFRLQFENEGWRTFTLQEGNRVLDAIA
jgi:DEAD/DEAH box helicase domain-containing protein